MKAVVINTLWLTSLALPYLAFAVHNSFRRNWLTLLRALIAIGIGWLFLFAYAVAVDGVNRSAAFTPEEIESVNSGDGARFVFAAGLGWVLPALIVGAGWLMHAVVFPRMRAKSSNNSLKSDAAKPRALG